MKPKFRVWNKELCKWEQDTCLLSQDGSLYHTEYMCRVGLSTHIVTFYTGLKDKNGVEIYEGDIIQSVSEMVRLDTNEKTGKIKTENYEVRWEPEKARWGRWKDNKFELLSGLDKGYLLKWYSVIGNIYENPELVDK